MHGCRKCTGSLRLCCQVLRQRAENGKCFPGTGIAYQHIPFAKNRMQHLLHSFTNPGFSVFKMIIQVPEQIIEGNAVDLIIHPGGGRVMCCAACGCC